MSRFISTESTVLLSLLCKKMPNLKKSISASQNSALTSQQILAAILHPSTIIKLTISTLATIQKALNDAASNKLGELTAQNTTLKEALAALIAAKNEEQNTGAKPKIPLDSEKTLQEQLGALKQTKEKLEPIIGDLRGSIFKVDKMIQKHMEIWQQHRETYFNELADQFKNNGLPLTNEEKAQLRCGTSTHAAIQEKLENLTKLGIKLPEKNPSDFSIITYHTVADALSRTLQKTDNESVKTIVKNLSVINKENTAANKLKKQCENDFAEVIKMAASYKNTANETKVLSYDQIESAENLKETVSLAVAEAKRPPALPQPKMLLY